MNQSDTIEIEELLALSEDSLLELFAKKSQLLGVGMLPHPTDDLIDAAREWLAEKLPQLRDLICSSSRIRALCIIPPGKESRLHLALAVSEVVGHHLVAQPGIAPFSVLCVKMGIEKMCEVCWRDTSPTSGT